MTGNFVPVSSLRFPLPEKTPRDRQSAGQTRDDGSIENSKKTTNSRTNGKTGSHSKAQAMIEFMLYVFITLFLLVSAAGLASVRSDEVSQLGAMDQREALCGQVAAAIDGVYFMGNNATAALALPDAIQGSNITVYIFGKETADNDSLVLIQTNNTGSGSYCRVRADPLRHANGSTIFTVGGNVTFTNRDGGVVVQ